MVARTRTRGHPFVMTVVGLIFLGAGVFFHIQFNRAEARLAAVSKWPARPARIIGSAVVTRRTSPRPGERVRTRAYARVVYSYQAQGGQTYTNETTPPGVYRRGGFEDANKMVRRFPAGAAAQVRVNPANPNDSELEGMEKERLLRTGRKVAAFAIGAGILMAIGGTVLTIRRRAAHRFQG